MTRLRSTLARPRADCAIRKPNVRTREVLPCAPLCSAPTSAQSSVLCARNRVASAAIDSCRAYTKFNHYIFIVQRKLPSQLLLFLKKFPRFFFLYSESCLHSHSSYIQVQLSAHLICHTRLDLVYHLSHSSFNRPRYQT